MEKIFSHRKVMDFCLFKILLEPCVVVPVENWNKESIFWAVQIYVASPEVKQNCTDKLQIVTRRDVALSLPIAIICIRSPAAPLPNNLNYCIVVEMFTL